MIHSIKVDALQKVKIWIDEPFRSLLNGPLLHGVEMEATNSIAEKSIIVEWFSPRGARVIYGLLGADFKPGENGILSISFAVPETTKTYSSTIVPSNIVSPETNIPTEIINEVIEEVSLFYSTRTVDVPKGILAFKHAAFCPVSSNKWIFRKITKLLLLILSSRSESSESKIIELISLL